MVIKSTGGVLYYTNQDSPCTLGLFKRWPPLQLTPPLLGPFDVYKVIGRPNLFLHNNLFIIAFFNIITIFCCFIHPSGELTQRPRRLL